MCEQLDSQEEPCFFFDCDNCLYPKSSGIYNLMKERIQTYFKKIGIDEERVINLQERYFIEYGLAIRGLVIHHEVDPIDYDIQVDGGLPLEEFLTPDPQLRRMIEGLKMKKWIFTNAGLAHAQRVLKILQIDDLFDGITYCDYSVPDFSCKPELEMYHRAMREAGVRNSTKCYFVDDTAANVEAAYKLGWTSVHVADNPQISNFGHFQIAKVTELPNVLPELWEGSQKQL